MTVQIIKDCLVAFGSNLGDAISIFRETQRRLLNIPGVDSLIASSTHRTLAVGGPADQPDYLNAAFRLRTSLDPQPLYCSLIDIEMGLGRQRRLRWGARKLDLDLLLYEQLTLATETLTIPHPRMSFRRFVLEPANEIAGDMLHPVANMTIAELVAHLDSTPHEILWATAIDDSIREIHAALSKQALSKNWQIHLVDRADDFAARGRSAKLVAWGYVQTEELNSAKFRGPQLYLPDNTLEIETELLAAIEAMT